MKYIVMECHPGYAVVLNENGRFSKVANMHYEVGQTVKDVVFVQTPETNAESVKKPNRRWIYSMVAAAACLLLVLLPNLFRTPEPYASVYMTINPEVRIDIDAEDGVMDIDGINEDGKTLIDGYSYKDKDLDVVVDELVDRAIELGFLHEGGTVTLSLDADDNEWVISHSDSLKTHLDDHLDDALNVTVNVHDKQESDDSQSTSDDDDDDERTCTNPYCDDDDCDDVDCDDRPDNDDDSDDTDEDSDDDIDDTDSDDNSDDDIDDTDSDDDADDDDSDDELNDDSDDDNAGDNDDSDNDDSDSDDSDSDDSDIDVDVDSDDDDIDDSDDTSEVDDSADVDDLDEENE